MHCDTISLPGGGTAVLCSGGVRQKRCRWCSRPAVFECDFPNPKRKSGTCDVACCESHSTHISPRVDYCLAHPLVNGPAKQLALELSDAAAN